MKRIIFIVFISAVSSMLFTGCLYGNKAAYDILEDTNWYEDINYYSAEIAVGNRSGYKKIDNAHKEAFDSVFNDIEILGARLCVPMKVSDLPEKFELMYSDGKPLSKAYGIKLNGGRTVYSYIPIYYDGEVRVAGACVVCEKDQRIEDGIIYELELGGLYIQKAIIGKSVAVNSDIESIIDYLGDGNTFYDNYSFMYHLYTDGNRSIELSYSLKYKGDNNFLLCYIRACEEYWV